VVASAFLVMLLSYGVRTSFGIFFKPMVEEFDWSRGLTSGAVTVSMMIQGLWGIYMGRLSDRIGSRLVITICSFLLGLGLLLMSLTNHPWQLYLFYGIITGFGMGGIFVSLISTIARWFVKKRGLMTGIVMAGIGAGTLTFAPLADFLISSFGWRWSYLICGGSMLVLGILAAQLLKKPPLMSSPQPEKIQNKQAVPAVGITLKQSLTTWQFWTLMVIFLCVGYCTFTITVHLVPHITDLGISSALAAGVLAVTGALQSLGGILLGFLADKIASRKVILISFILVTASLFLLVPITTIMPFYLFAVFYSIGIGGSTAMESTVVAEMFGMRSHGVILGAVSFGFTIGAAVGPYITGLLFDLTQSYTPAIFITAGTGVLGLLLTVLITWVKKSEIRGLS